MDYQKEFFDASYQKLVDAINNIPAETAADVYAFSFYLYCEDDDTRQQMLEVSYNTEKNYKASIDEAYDEMEARWNYAFWLQKEILALGGPEDDLWQKWVKSTPFYYENDEDKSKEKYDGISDMFLEMVIELSQKIHADGGLVQKFGKAIPVIMHGLEYCEYEFEWALRANPEGIVDEFLSWDVFDTYKKEKKRILRKLEQRRNKSK